MTLIYSVILCILFLVVSCQLQCHELTNKPTVTTGLMMEGQSSSLTCSADTFCNKALTIHWIWTKADGQSVVLHGRSMGYYGDAIIYENELELTPTAEDHNTNITCVADYHDIGYVVETTVSLSVRFPPKILNRSWCMVEGKHAVRCVCISQGNPPPQITWSSVPLTSSSSIGTVSSTITMHADNITCLSRNALGQVESDIPLQSDTDNYGPKISGATIPWIIAGVSLSLNLVLLTTLIICTCKRGRGQQREPREEMNTYASLNRADVGQEYSVISPRTRGSPGMAHATTGI